MENSQLQVIPHPLFLEALFAHRKQVMQVFKDVLGLHQINHLAITQIDEHQRMLTFSSTPSLEFNLFSSPLWRFDNSYNPEWYQLNTHASWQSLYQPERYDELYFLKQIKHAYPIGVSLATQSDNNQYIFTLATKKSCPYIQELFNKKRKDFYCISQYCVKNLQSMFERI